jgi:hypothetical protein
MEKAVHFVVAAHLKENATLIQRFGCGFVCTSLCSENVVWGCGIDKFDSERRQGNPSYPWPVFEDTTKGLYISTSIDATAAAALLAADRSFQFFGSDGNVAEEPHNGHLKVSCSKWKHYPNATGVQRFWVCASRLNLGRSGLIKSTWVMKIYERFLVFWRSKVKGLGSTSRNCCSVRCMGII